MGKIYRIGLLLRLGQRTLDLERSNGQKRISHKMPLQTKRIAENPSDEIVVKKDYTDLFSLRVRMDELDPWVSSASMCTQ